MATTSVTSVPLDHLADDVDPTRHDVDCCEDALQAFLKVRSRLIGIARRMLGSAHDAEDLVQDVWLRWQAADRRHVRDAAAFLVTTAKRLAINLMQSARSRRETSASPWLPDPVDPSADPRMSLERSQALVAGCSVLLETLTPIERAAYILREAFDYSYREIATVLRLEEANARQVVTRARQRAATRRLAPARARQLRRLLQALLSAARQGNVAGLERLLASEAGSCSRNSRVARAA